MSSLFVILAAAIAIPLLLVWLFPETTQRWFRRIQAARKALFGLILVALGVALLASGVPTMMVLGALTFSYAALLFYYDRPGTEALEWIRS